MAGGQQEIRGKKAPFPSCALTSTYHVLGKALIVPTQIRIVLKITQAVADQGVSGRLEARGSLAEF